jgi:hypothetical protein
LIDNTRQMDLLSLIRDNIDEILVKVIQFTYMHHNLISDNIKNCRVAGFIPRYIDVEDFAKVISAALTEHQSNNRLALCDSRTVNFLPGGNFTLEPQIDLNAVELIDSDFDAYLKLQKDRLRENTINNRTACALLEHKLYSLRQPINQTSDNSVKNKA